MKLPEAASKVGVVENNRAVYIEDYVLQYLKILKGEKGPGEDKLLLYGRQERTAKAEVYAVYGICGSEEGHRPLRGAAGWSYEFIGSLDVGLWKSGKDYCQGIFIGNKAEAWPVKGYYIFYEADAEMKDRLGRYYKESMDHKTSTRQQMPGKQKAGQQKAEGQKHRHQRIERREPGQEASPYLWIRIVAAGILIVLCAIAVTTVNGYEKINDFVQAAAQTWEILEEDP